MHSIIYRHAPINSQKALQRALHCNTNELNEALDSIRYRQVPLKKKDGGTRIAYDAVPPLKFIQKRITSNIFQKITFPYYIHGCIRDKTAPRSIYTNAEPHAGKKYIINCDIKNFFPSISDNIVYDIYRYCLNFSPEVSNTLTILCTLDGHLPQGASPSSYLANLVFWDVEPILVKELETKGFTYTRFADDITISTNKELKNSDKSAAINIIRNRLRKKNCTLHKNKTMVLRRGKSIKIRDKNQDNTYNVPVSVTGLTVCNSKIGISKIERKKIRAAVHRLSQEDLTKISQDSWKTKFSSAMGKVSRLCKCGYKEGDSLKSQLRLLNKKYKRICQRRANVSGLK